MPELPEVETTKNALQPLLIGKKITQIDLFTAQLRQPLQQDLLNQILNVEISSIDRRAKYLMMLFHGTDKQLLIHLGMSGHMKVLPYTQLREKHEHVVMRLSDDYSLRYHDPRKFGLIILSYQQATQEKFAHLGPEPLSKDFTSAYLYQASQRRKIAIKGLIMQQEVVVGVGNIYATEALFDSGIHPLTCSRRLSKKQIERLVFSIQKVLKKAILTGGTTLKDFSNPLGGTGYFQQELMVYGRAGEHCTVCNTLIRAQKIAGRTSSYCPNCQTE